MTNEMCGNCRYWLHMDDLDNEPDTGMCRRWAPKPKLFAMETGEWPGADVLWPELQRTDWCGEWRKATDILNRQKP